MKTFKATLLGIFASAGLFAQTYMVDVGNVNYSERLQDAIEIPTGSGTTGLMVGLTNADTRDRILLTAIDANSGSVLYQKKYVISYPTTLKEWTVANTVRIAHDNSSTSNTCMIAGSYYRNSGGSNYGFGWFTMTIDYTTGGILSIKRWESAMSGATNTSIASLCAGPGNNFYLAGSVNYGTSQQSCMTMALNSSNTMLWNLIDQDLPVLTGSFTPASIVYSPYTPTGANEVVVAGYLRAYTPGYNYDVFVRRFNASTGALIAQNLCTTGTTERHTITSIIPSRSSTGAYDGFLLCGSYTDNTATDCGWLIKTNTTANAITWSKSYKYNGSGSNFTFNDAVAVDPIGGDPYGYYVIGTATNGISGSTADVVALKIDAAGSVTWQTTVAPSVNKHEDALVALQHPGPFTYGVNLYGNRINPSNSLQIDMTSIRIADWGAPTGYYLCQTTINTPYTANNVALTVNAYSSHNYSTLNSSTLNQSLTSPNDYSLVCFDALSLGRYSAPAGTGDETVLVTPVAYPNPSAGIYFLKGEAGPSLIEVFSADGKLVLREEVGATENYRIDISGLADGIYKLVLISGDEMHSDNLVKSSQ